MNFMQVAKEFRTSVHTLALYGKREPDLVKGEPDLASLFLLVSRHLEPDQPKARLY
jgi:hypothetical protein